MEYKLFLDTNALLELQASAFAEPFVISQETLSEIEGIKTAYNKDGEIKYKARNVARLLREHEGEYEVALYSEDIEELLRENCLSLTPDNIIVATAYQYNKKEKILMCTDDLVCSFISKYIFGLPTKSVFDLHITRDISEYKGYIDVTLSDEEMSDFYQRRNENVFGCLINEYVIIRKSDGEIVDYLRWDGDTYKSISYKQVNTHYMGKVKPINPEQRLAFDMLQNKDITIKVLSGKFGTGKDFIMLSNALKMVEDGKYDKLVYVRNTMGVSNVSEIGFLPGTKDEKILWGAMPLADHLGGEHGLEIQVMQGNIVIEHLGFIRGRDFKNSILYCSEAENLTKEHVQLLIGRIGEGSSLWLNGDFKQTDSPLFRMNNGLISSINKLAGHEKFGYVQLQKTERSETAAMADLLD